MSKSINILEDGERVEVYFDRIAVPSEVRDFAKELLAVADKAEEKVEEAKKFGVFKGAKPGDIFISNKGTVFVLGEPTECYRKADQVLLWQVNDGVSFDDGLKYHHTTYADLGYWNGDGHTEFKRLRAFGDLFERNTFGKRQAYIVGEGLL